jgi:hypothetical protein
MSPDFSTVNESFEQVLVEVRDIEDVFTSFSYRVTLVTHHDIDPNL